MEYTNQNPRFVMLWEKAIMENKLHIDQRGFTLVEIMIVILIMGILLAIAVPGYSTARRESREKTCFSNLRQIEYAMEQCALDTSKVSGDTIAWDELVPKYIKTKPSCPAGGNYTCTNLVGRIPVCSVHGYPPYQGTNNP
jgi:prepilin-type N-terminal cleavage/methylation domain-containing protein